MDFMVINHIGIAVKSLDEAASHWKSVFGYQQATLPVINTRQKVRVMFLKKQGSIDIKLMEPTDESSPIFQFTKRGGGLHHLCFKCDNIESELEKMKTLGLRIIAPAQPGEAFGNEKIAFVFAKFGLNIELIDTDKRAKQIFI
jgi:methylmalonyl-CoA/ethylmalonyl-CoA epimerase